MLTNKVLKMLVVEDEAWWFDVLKKEIERRSLPLILRWSPNGQKALELLEHGATFDVVLMNLEMPLLGGEQATKAIRAMGIKTPIIAWTAHSASRLGKICQRAGMNYFVEKKHETLIQDVIEALHQCGVTSEES